MNVVTDEKKDPLSDIDPDFARLVREVQANTEAELRELSKKPAKYTRETGMIDPDLDISATPYEPEKVKEKV